MQSEAVRPRVELEVHRTLAERTPLTSGVFARWIALFHATVDDLFAGATAEHTKRSASRIAMALQHHIAADRGVELAVATRHCDLCHKELTRFSGNVPSDPA
jgi:hemoglobin